MTDNLSLSQVATSQLNKETTINDKGGELDAAITASAILLVDDTDAATLTEAVLNRAVFIQLDEDSPAPDAPITITVEDFERGMFVFFNNTSFDATVEVSAQPLASPVVAAGATKTLFMVGGDVRNSLPIATNRIELGLGTLREIVTNDIDTSANHGGILTSDSTPSYARVNGATDKALRVTWGASNVDEVQFPPVFMPPDLDESVDLTIHLVARMSGATDTPTIDVQVFDGIGDTEMGGATAALSNTLQELTVTIANADILGHPLGFLNIALVSGTHTTDDLELYAAWIEYRSKDTA